MKSIMLTIRPEWVEKILNSEKTIEIRKTMPKCELPAKVYIYCTKGKRRFLNVFRKGEIKWFGKDENDTYEKTEIITKPHFDYGDRRYDWLGKVVAEFTLKKVEKFDVPYPAYFYEVEERLKPITKESCLSLVNLHHYLKNDTGYAWHIDNLKIYDKPKELSEFRTKCDVNFCSCCPYGNFKFELDLDYFKYVCKDEGNLKPLKRPPQSWCYVEDIGGNDE